MSKELTDTRVSLTQDAKKALALEAAFRRVAMGDLASEIILKNVSQEALKAAGLVASKVIPRQPHEPDGLKEQILTWNNVNEKISITRDKASQGLILSLKREGLSGHQIAERFKAMGHPRCKSSINEWIARQKKSME